MQPMYIDRSLFRVRIVLSRTLVVQLEQVYDKGNSCTKKKKKIYAYQRSDCFYYFFQGNFFHSSVYYKP